MSLWALYMDKRNEMYVIDNSALKPNGEKMTDLDKILSGGSLGQLESKFAELRAFNHTLREFMASNRVITTPEVIEESDEFLGFLDYKRDVATRKLLRSHLGSRSHNHIAYLERMKEYRGKIEKTINLLDGNVISFDQLCDNEKAIYLGGEEEVKRRFIQIERCSSPTDQKLIATAFALALRNPIVLVSADKNLLNIMRYSASHTLKGKAAHQILQYNPNWESNNAECFFNIGKARQVYTNL